MNSAASKEDVCVDFIRNLWLNVQTSLLETPKPLLVGLSGVQGVGKSSIVGNFRDISTYFSATAKFLIQILPR